MRTMPAGEFKAKCLAVMDEVQATGQAVLITKRGKPVARLFSVEAAIDASGAPLPVSPRATSSSRPWGSEDSPQKKKSVFGRLRPMGVITGDIVSSELTDQEWDRMFDEKWARFEKSSAE